MGGRPRRTADVVEAHSIFLHGVILFEPGTHVLEKRFRSRVGRFRDPVVHPLAFASRFYNSRTAEIGEMAGDFRLIRAEDFHEEAYANLAIPNEIQQPQPRSIGESAEKQCDIQFVLSHDRSLACKYASAYM